MHRRAAPQRNHLSAPTQERNRAFGTDFAPFTQDYAVEAVAIGNGTAGRETEEFVRGLHVEGVEIFLVSEDGASVYSASATAREEFPDYDVTVRGTVSIGADSPIPWQNS